MAKPKTLLKTAFDGVKDQFPQRPVTTVHHQTFLGVLAPLSVYHYALDREQNNEAQFTP